MTKLDKLIILVMEELANEGFKYRRTDENELTASRFNIRIRFSKMAHGVYINTEDYEFNEIVFYNLKNERSRLITTGAIMNTFFRILSGVLAKRQHENVSRETSDTENVSRETYTAPEDAPSCESAITPFERPEYTIVEINNELSKMETCLEELLHNELESYTFKYDTHPKYQFGQAIMAFMIDDKMFTICFVTKYKSLDGIVMLNDAFTDEILYEKEYLCFNPTNYHRTICSEFYHIVRTIKRSDSLDGWRKIN